MKFIYSVFCTFLYLSVSGQTILMPRLLPALGDSLYYAIDSNAAGISITAPGPNQNWDYSQLQPIGSTSEVYRRPSLGTNASSFPNADLLLLQGVTEYYYKLFPNRLDLMGTGLRSGGLPIPGISGVNVYPKQVIEQKYPERYLDTLSYLTKTSVAFPSSILPDTILKGLPLVPDSIRIVYNTRVRKEADAWGTIKLPAHTWNVLREKRNTINQVTLEAKVPILGWLDVTGLIGASFPQLFGTFKSLGYAFLSNETKGLIALVNVDSLDQVLSVQYKPDDKIILKTENGISINTIGIFPNPVSDELHFELNGLNSTYYNISIFDAGGKSYSNQRMFINTDLVNSVNVHALKAGLYFLQISDQKKQKWNSAIFVKQ